MVGGQEEELGGEGEERHWWAVVGGGDGRLVVGSAYGVGGYSAYAGFGALNAVRAS